MFWEKKHLQNANVMRKLRRNSDINTILTLISYLREPMYNKEILMKRKVPKITK